MSDIKQETDKRGSRKYTNAAGRSYPSVTTVLSKFEDKRWLWEWKKNNPDHASLTNRAASIGTRVHSCNEDLLLNGTVDFSRYEEDSKVTDEALEEIKTRHATYMPFLSKVKSIAVEEKLIWERHDGVDWYGFGGTTDLIGYIEDPSFLKVIEKKEDGEIEYLDFLKEPFIFVSDYKNWKSANAPDRCIKYYCQLAAYAAAKNELLAPQNKIKHGILLGTTYGKTGKSKLYTYYINLEELNFYFSWFNLFVKGYFDLVPREKISWSLFKELAVGYYKKGEDEDGKAVWGEREKNYLGKKLEVIYDV